MDREKSVLLDIVRNEQAADDDRFNAAAALAELGYVDEASAAFSTLSSSRNVAEEVRKSAAEASQQVLRGEVPDDWVSAPMPAPPAPPTRPPRPL